MPFPAATALDRSLRYTEAWSLHFFSSNLSLETECENTFPCLQVFFPSSSADPLLAHHLEGAGETTLSISGVVMFNLMHDGNWEHALSAPWASS